MAIEIELRQMRYFLAVAQERSFTRAAARCHVAQPSLSKQIHEMERTLDARLFERLPRDVRLTAAGRIFEKEVAKALEHSSRAVSLVRALEGETKHVLRIGLSTLCDIPRMGRLLETARKSSSLISVEHTTASTPDLVLALLRGDLDLAVVDLPLTECGISFVQIHFESLIALLPKGHVLASRPIVRLFELKKERIILLSQRIDPGMSIVESALHSSGIEASSIRNTQNVIDLLDEVALHRSIGLMRSSAGRLRRDDVISKPLAGSIQLESAIAWRKENCSPRMVSLRDALIALSQRSSANEHVAVSGCKSS